MTQAPANPTPTVIAADFIEWDALAPGPVYVNLNHLMFVHPDQQGLAVLVFDRGERVPLNISYDEVKAAIAAVP